jgi:uncharacterized membrane protein YhaH (DUF805 family)/type II secretory pathway pseudopilin PulG
MNDAWYTFEQGRQVGPHTRAQLVARLEGGLPLETEVWRDGLAAWTPAASLPEITSALRAVRPAATPPAPAIAPGRPAGALAAAPDDDTLNPIRLVRLCLTFGGRFGRLQYFIAGLAVAFMVGLFGAFDTSIAQVTDQNAINFIATLVAVIGLLFALVCIAGGTVRRLHDLGQSGWLALLMLLPCINTIMGLWLLFAPGTPRASAAVSGIGSPAAAAPRRRGLSPVTVLLIIAGGLVAVFAIGIVAAIAIPSLLRARVSANESATIGDLRAIVSGQTAYRQASGGSYAARLDCLATPAQCLPGYAGATLVADGSVLQSPRNGYLRELHVPEGAAATGAAEAYAIVAYPAAQNKTGVRAFCADSSGRLCAKAEASALDLVEKLEGEPWVRCAASCADLR